MQRASARRARGGALPLYHAAPLPRGNAAQLIAVRALRHGAMRQSRDYARYAAL